jgi:hypothetical protein
VPLRKITIAQTIASLVISCMNSFREAYAGAGMNLVQSMVVVAVAMAQSAGRVLTGHARRIRK